MSDNLNPLFRDILAPYAPGKPAEVIQKSGPSFTTYTITGDIEAVKYAVDTIMHRFNPWGYGTIAKYTETGAIVTRANSCD